MDSLASNPSSGVFGQPKPQTDNDVLSVVNKLKDREMLDFRNKANFMSDLSLRQQFRQRQMFPPEQASQNTVLAPDPNQMSGYQKGELDLKQQQLGQDKSLDSQKLAQQGKLGQEALDVKTAQEKLNQQKSDQINTSKQADLQRKIDESNNKLDLANRALEAKTQAGEDTLQAHKDLAAAVEERHNAEREITKHKMDVQDEQFKALRLEHDNLLKQNQNTVQTKTDNTGASITTTTKKGDAVNAPVKNPDGTYTVTSPNGTKGVIPADKLGDWMQNHQSGGE
jgi:hypothetical protein